MVKNRRGGKYRRQSNRPRGKRLPKPPHDNDNEEDDPTYHPSNHPSSQDTSAHSQHLEHVAPSSGSFTSEFDDSSQPISDETDLGEPTGPNVPKPKITLKLRTGRDQSSCPSGSVAETPDISLQHNQPTGRVSSPMRGIGYSALSNPRAGAHSIPPRAQSSQETDTSAPLVAASAADRIKGEHASTVSNLGSRYVDPTQFAGKRLPGSIKPPAQPPVEKASTLASPDSGDVSPRHFSEKRLPHPINPLHENSEDRLPGSIIPPSSSAGKRLAGKRLPGYIPSLQSSSVSSLRPANLAHSAAQHPVSEQEEASSPEWLPEEDDGGSSVSDPESELETQPHPESILPSIEIDETEMAPRSSRGRRGSGIPEILPQTLATQERRARERLARQKETQEARKKPAQEIKAPKKESPESPVHQAQVEIATPSSPATQESSPSPKIGIQQAVIDYLAKKGYSRTEAMLRMESANQEIDGRPLPQLGEDSRPKTRQGFDLLKNWVEENLDLYKPELRRILWPLFVYSFFNMVTSFYSQDAKSFFEANKNMFLPEHTDDIRRFEPLSLPEHLQDNSLAKLYRTNKYRIVLSNPAYTNLLQFLESKDKEGGSVMNAILSSFCSVKTLDRATDDRFSFAAMLSQTEAGQTFPAEDEGIPGHHPGSAYTGDNPAMAGTLPRLRLGKLPLEQTLEEDVRAELAEEDRKEGPTAGRNTLVREFDEMIKKEDDEEFPSRADIPFPASTTRDVQVEVRRVMEHRDRFKIEGRTGGVGPGVSVCMFTFHNTFDSMNCIDISDDNELIAAGFQQSYIRVWALDGKALPKRSAEFADMPDANSRRLIGHSGAVYAVAFPPCASARDNIPEKDRVDTGPRWLLSASADKTIRLWSLDTWQCMVVYKGHDRPVWDLRWGPFGHYFLTGSSDRTGRLWVTDQVRQQRFFVGHDQDVDCVCFHPNSAYVFTASSDRTVRMWAITTGNSVRMFTGGHTGNITAMECSRDGKILASADDQGTITLWDLAPGRILKRMRGHGKGGIWSLSWSVESTVLVSGGADGTVRIWDINGPQENQGRVIGEGGAGTKMDAGPTPAGSSKKKKGKETVVTADQISAFPTKKSPVYKVKFTNMNLVLAAGAYLPT